MLAAAGAGATTIIPAADPGELALDSQAVFLARAGDSIDSSRSGYLTTVTELEVLSVVKGNMSPGDLVEIVAPRVARRTASVGRWQVRQRLTEGEVYLFFADLDAVTVCGSRACSPKACCSVQWGRTVR